MNNLPCVGEKWNHFKGSTYVILGFAWCAVGEELRLRVRYQKCAPGHAAPMGPEFTRTIDNFLMPVGDANRPRFEKAA